MSILVPAKNEQAVLANLVQNLFHLDYPATHLDIWIIDDGSTDATSNIVEKFVRIRPQVRLIRLPRNRGKGHAVRTGVLNAYGRLILFTDADGATPIAELQRLESALDTNIPIAIGSRALASTSTHVHTRWYRRLLGRCFNAYVNLLLLPGLQDTQCGFKLFEAKVARFLFERQHADRYSFDVELLYIARRAGIGFAEVAINWTNVPGSKVNLVADSIRMAIDVMRYRLRHRNVPSFPLPASVQPHQTE